MIEKDPEADPNCKVCNGYGRVNFGNICTGFGGTVETMSCMCKVYKKIGINSETGEKLK